MTTTVTITLTAGTAAGAVTGADVVRRITEEARQKLADDLQGQAAGVVATYTIT